MNKDDAEEFTQSLGMIAGGAWRQIMLAEKLGVPQALGLSLKEWVNQRLGGYVRLSIEDRREAVAELTAEGISNVKIAEVVGVDEGTIRNDKRSENSEPKKTRANNCAPQQGTGSENSEPITPMNKEQRAEDLRIQKKVGNGAPLTQEEEARSEEYSNRTAREIWLKGFAEHLKWCEMFLDRSDEYLAWYTLPGAPGMFDHGITAERILMVIERLKRAAEVTFCPGGHHAQKGQSPKGRPCNREGLAQPVSGQNDTFHQSRLS